MAKKKTESDPQLDFAVLQALYDSMSDAELRESALGNWVRLNKVLQGAKPVLVHRLLALELRAKDPRLQIIQRLYGRLSKMRADREKKVLILYATGQDDIHHTQGRAAENVLRDLAPLGRSDW